MLGLCIPLYNEEEIIDRSLSQLLFALKELPHQTVVVLVDNGSTDATKSRVQAWLPENPMLKLISLPHNHGYGGGILAGLKALEPYQPKWIGWMWGDSQIDPSILSPMCKALSEGALIVKTRRSKREDGKMRFLITTLYHFLMSIKGLSLVDINGCPKIFQWEVYTNLNLSSLDWFIDAEAMFKATSNGIPVHSIETTMKRREGGRSKVKLNTLVEFCRNIYRL